MESVWQKNSSLPSFSSLQQDIKTDVLVIGGGIAGILTAYCLKENGIKCVLVEKNRICGGNTGRTTAKITSQHGFIYDKILQSAGREKAQMYLLANENALKKYKELCKDIDCDFEEKDNFVYSAKSLNKIKNEIYALEKIGFKAEYHEHLPLPVKNVGAVCFRNQAQFNPLKFLGEVTNNIEIYENTFVRDVDKHIAKAGKWKIEAENIVIATHFPFIDRHGLYPLKMYQHRSYAIALENACDVNGMYVDESKTGLSFRNCGKYLIVGGGDHRTGRQGGNWKEIREFAAENYPDSNEVAWWAAQDCMTLDGIPYIGNYSKNTPHLYVATGFNKWGMTSAMAAAEILTDMISGRNNDCAAVFNPSRSIIKPQLLVNGFEAAVSLLTPSKRRCPHLGCALKWNEAEHSWDCPCHGSRFDENGKVLDNPTNKH